MEHAKAEAARETKAEEKKAGGEAEADVADADFEVVEEEGEIVVVVLTTELGSKLIR